MSYQFMRDLFPPGLWRFIFFSTFAVGWLLAAIYFAGIESKEREMMRQIIRRSGFLQ